MDKTEDLKALARFCLKASRRHLEDATRNRFEASKKGFDHVLGDYHAIARINEKKGMSKGLEIAAQAAAAMGGFTLDKAFIEQSLKPSNENKT